MTLKKNYQIFDLFSCSGFLYYVRTGGRQPLGEEDVRNFACYQTVSADRALRTASLIFSKV